MDRKGDHHALPTAPIVAREMKASGPSRAVSRTFVALALLFTGGYLFREQHTSIPNPRTQRTWGQSLTSCKQNPDAVWDKIAPNAHLKWTQCYEDKQCAKLSVPLDYADGSGGQAAIALIKVASKTPPGHDGYLGPVLFNPGGPGGSGVQMVEERGKQFQTILGDGYDIIGFDPRGVGFTEPRLKLFADESEGTAWELRHAANPPLNTTPDALARGYARWKVFGDLAKERLAEAGQYVSTALVARDMLRITEASGYEKLKYWGFSYGSVLGITFAAMFPDKVERLIVDGVCDTYNYYETQWSNNLRDTDAGLHMVYEGCVGAGPDACALYAPDAAGVKARADAIFATLKKRPIPVLPVANASQASEGADYGLVDYAMARGLVFKFLYSPYGKRMDAVALVSALAAIEKGDGRPLWDLSLPYRTKGFKCECDREGDAKQQAQSHNEALLAIACSDGDAVDDNLAELQTHYDGMAKMSGFAELWDIRVKCAGWKIRPKERFGGPFVGNTSHPIMLIGNTADPVTPLWNARKMALGFKNAAVLHQKSAGHCSLNAASLCTAKVVRDYFRHGVVPHPGKVCEVESRIFGGPAPAQILSADDSELLQAVRGLSQDFNIPMLHM